MELLKDKVAMITGAASGIGRATAIAFARHGARVALLDLPNSQGREVVREIGDAARFFPCDVSDESYTRTAVEQSVAQFGRLDVVFANAGINGVWAPIDELAPAAWDRTIAINLRGAFLTLHLTIPHLRRAGGGSIIINASVNGTRTFSNPGATAYAASKAGQVALMKMAALELGRDRIRANAVCPGAIHTSIDQSVEKRHIERIDIKLEMTGVNPALNAGQGEPEDVADVCVFLASDLSRHVSGVELFVDGGYSLLR